MRRSIVSLPKGEEILKIISVQKGNLNCTEEHSYFLTFQKKEADYFHYFSILLGKGISDGIGFNICKWVSLNPQFGSAFLSVYKYKP